MVTNDKDTSVDPFSQAQHSIQRISQAFASIQLTNYVKTGSSLIQYLISVNLEVYSFKPLMVTDDKDTSVDPFHPV